MRTKLMASLAGVAIAAITAQSAQSHSYLAVGKPGDPNKPSRVIEIILTEEYGLSTYQPERVTVKHNEQIRFVLKNSGRYNHEFMLGTTAANLKHAADMKKNPQMEHDDPNGVVLKPGQSGQLLWRFTKRGTFEYGCLVPGHREEGMIGTIVVK